jgi:hypothetical protein
VSFRVPPLLLAVPLLGIARLLPETGFGLWLRLAAASLVLLIPGRLAARVLGMRGAAPALAWSLGIVAAAFAVTIALHSSLDLTLALVVAAAAGLLPFSVVSRRHGRLTLSARERAIGVQRGRGLVVVAGLALGGALWWVAGIVHGDALFHLGRVRKLDVLGSLSLHALDEFRNGGLHPGYAFPLWHVWLGLLSKLAGVDPAAVVLHESSILAPLALLLAFEMGIAVFGSVWLGAATMLVQAGLTGFAPGHGGAYTSLALPGTVARQLLVPAALALFFPFLRHRSWTLALTLAVLGLDLALIHSSYALFLAFPLIAFVAARALLARADVRAAALGLVALALPIGVVFALLLPLVDETRAHTPSPSEQAAMLRHYAADLAIHSQSSYALAPSVVVRGGSIAVAALLLTPLAALAARRRWAALVLGGTVLVLGLELWSLVFPTFADVVSLSQARRAAGFVPFVFAFAGGAAVLARLVGPLLLPVALAAGIALQLAFPGDFGVRSAHTGPSVVAWIALWGGLAGLLAGAFLVRRGRGSLGRGGPVAALAAALFTIPVVVHGFAAWTPEATTDPHALTPGLVSFLRREVGHRNIVFADLATSYRISAYVPVYVAAGPPSHVADTKANRLRDRRRAVLRFLRTANLAIPRYWRASWLVLLRTEPVAAVERHGLRPVYADRTFVVFHLRL